MSWAVMLRRLPTLRTLPSTTNCAPKLSGNFADIDVLATKRER